MVSEATDARPMRLKPKRCSMPKGAGTSSSGNSINPPIRHHCGQQSQLVGQAAQIGHAPLSSSTTVVQRVQARPAGSSPAARHWTRAQAVQQPKAAVLAAWCSRLHFWCAASVTLAGECGLARHRAVQGAHGASGALVSQSLSCRLRARAADSRVLISGAGSGGSQACSGKVREAVESMGRKCRLGPESRLALFGHCLISRHIMTDTTGTTDAHLLPLQRPEPDLDRPGDDGPVPRPATASSKLPWW